MAIDLTPVTPVGPIPPAPCLRWIGDDVGLQAQYPAHVTMRASISGAQFDFSLPQVLEMFEELDYHGQKRVQEWVLVAWERGYLHPEDAAAVAAFAAARARA